MVTLIRPLTLPSCLPQAANKAAAMSKYYEATGPDCDCICGGRNHGAGQDQAIENTRELAETMIAEYAETHALPEFQASVNQDIFQLPLPGF